MSYAPPGSIVDMTSLFPSGYVAVLLSVALSWEDSCFCQHHQLPPATVWDTGPTATNATPFPCQHAAAPETEELGQVCFE